MKFEEENKGVCNYCIAQLLLSQIIPMMVHLLLLLQVISWLRLVLICLLILLVNSYIIYYK